MYKYVFRLACLRHCAISRGTGIFENHSDFSYGLRKSNEWRSMKMQAARLFTQTCPSKILLIVRVALPVITRSLATSLGSTSGHTASTLSIIDWGIDLEVAQAEATTLPSSAMFKFAPFGRHVMYGFMWCPRKICGAWGARFSKAQETFRARKAIGKSRTLRLQSCFIQIFLIWREVPFIQEVSGVYTSPFLGTVELKVVLSTRSGTDRTDRNMVYTDNLMAKGFR